MTADWLGRRPRRRRDRPWARAYDPLHVERLSTRDVRDAGPARERVYASSGEEERDRGRDRDAIWECPDDGGASDMVCERLGETDMRDGDGNGGAYIWESWERTRGEVRAESSWRTLSHCVSIVWRDEDSAMRIEGRDEAVEGDGKALVDIVLALDKSRRAVLTSVLRLQGY